MRELSWVGQTLRETLVLSRERGHSYGHTYPLAYSPGHIVLVLATRFLTV